jgi:hypothetical protein
MYAICILTKSSCSHIRLSFQIGVLSSRRLHVPEAAHCQTVSGTLRVTFILRWTVSSSSSLTFVILLSHLPSLTFPGGPHGPPLDGAQYTTPPHTIIPTNRHWRFPWPPPRKPSSGRPMPGALHPNTGCTCPHLALKSTPSSQLVGRYHAPSRARLPSQELRAER